MIANAAAPNADAPAVVEDADPPWWGRVFCEDAEGSPERVIRHKALSDRIAIEAHRQEIRSRCYAAAMARWWRASSAEQFLDMRHGPKKLPVELRGQFPVRPAEANGLKTLVQLSMERLDRAWEEQGDDLVPDRARWEAMPLAMPTPVEQNKRLCVVPPPCVPPPKRIRVGK